MTENNITNQKISTEDLVGLPASVQQYMAFSGVVGRPWIKTVVVKQTGGFRRAPDQPWMPVSALQTFTTDPPGFVWKASFKMFGLPMMSARDSYQAGHGNMFGKLAGLFTIFDVRGSELDQGSLVRYLGEMIWFPTAFLGKNVTWQGIDDHSAQVTLSDGGNKVTARIVFDAQGRPTLFSTNRYQEQNGKYALVPWSVPMDTYREFGGLTIPAHGLVTWNYPAGDFGYFDWEITGVEYNTI